MKIWLASNIEAHSFIPQKYWTDNYKAVKEAVKKASVYVYDDKSEGVAGFIGISDGYIAGLFIRREMRSKGVGKKLLDYAKTRHSSLRLQVYVKNKHAVKFYLRENFIKISESIDESTGEAEYTMLWKK